MEYTTIKIRKDTLQRLKGELLDEVLKNSKDLKHLKHRISHDYIINRMGDYYLI